MFGWRVVPGCRKNAKRECQFLLCIFEATLRGMIVILRESPPEILIQYSMWAGGPGLNDHKGGCPHVSILRPGFPQLLRPPPVADRELIIGVGRKQPRSQAKPVGERLGSEQGIL